MPPDPDGKARFAREYSERLTGLSTEEMTCLIQPHNHDASCRVTITVPQRHREAIRRIEESGLGPAFSEPEQPILEDKACILPSTFQILHFGGEIDPRSVSNHPGRLSIIAKTLAEHVPGLPEAAQDFLNWIGIETDGADRRRPDILERGIAPGMAPNAGEPGKKHQAPGVQPAVCRTTEGTCNHAH